LIGNVDAQVLNNIDGDDADLAGGEFFVLFVLLMFWVVFSIFMGAYSVLFGISLLKIKDKVKHGKSVGILNIVAGATYIILVGFLVRIVAYICEILLLFDAAKRFEK